LQYKCGLRMTIKFKLQTNKPESENGYALIVLISEKQKRREREIGRFFKDNYDETNSTVKESHTDFKILAPRMLQMKLHLYQNM